MASTSPGQGTSTALSDYQIYTLAAENGFSTVGESKYGGYSQATVATAIALAESDGNPNATNVNHNGSTDRGVWQINSSHTLGELGLAGGKVSDLFNPVNNAKAAYAVFKSQGFGNSKGGGWATYNSGAYKPYILRALAASKQANSSTGSTSNGPLSGPTNAQGEPTTSNEVSAASQDAANGLPGILGGFVSWAEGGVIRVAYFLGGSVLLIFFLWKAGGE